MDVLFTLNRDTWDEAQQRYMCFSPDRMLLQLMSHAELGQLVVAEGLRSAPVRLIKAALGRRPSPFPSNRRFVLYSPLRLRRFDPTSPSAVQRHYRRHGRRLQAAARQAGLERPLVITTNPFVAAFSPLDWADRVVFFAWDDWAAHPSFRRWWPAYEQAYAAIGERGWEVWAVSHALANRISPRLAVVAPNGIDPTEWVDPAPPPDWFAGLPRPRVLYTGTLDSRIDVDAIRRTAEALPTASVVLVGRAQTPSRFTPLAHVGNVHLAGEVRRSEIPSLVRAADVCIIPHARTRLTEAMSPLKLYEYLAGGRPVAATDLQPVRGLGGRVVLVREGEDFADAVKRAMALGPAHEGERRELIRRHSWEARYRPLLDSVLQPTTSASL